MTRDAGRPLLPAPLPPRADGRRRRRQRRPRRASCGWCARRSAGTASSTAPPSRSSPARSAQARAASAPGVVEATRQFEQVNVVLGMQGLTRSDPRRFALGVLNAALGGGTSSRLFQEVREKRGLAYSVFSFASQHVDAGLVGVSVGLPARQARPGARASSAPSSPRSPSPASPTRSWPAARVSCKGGLVLGLEDSGVADDPARQGRAGRRRAAQHRRGARPDRRGHPRRRTRRWPPSCSPSPRSWPSSVPRSDVPPDVTSTDPENPGISWGPSRAHSTC